MFNVGENVIYKRDVCVVKEIKEKHYRNMDYYILAPVEDKSLTIEVPVENKKGYLRNIISKERALELIDSISSIEPIITTQKIIDIEYKNLMNSGKLDDLIKIIKTAYLRNDERIKASKKVGEKDDTYFKMSEKILYNELSLALNMDYDTVKKYVCDTVENNLM